MNQANIDVEAPIADAILLDVNRDQQRIAELESQLEDLRRRTRTTEENSAAVPLAEISAVDREGEQETILQLLSQLARRRAPA